MSSDPYYRDWGVAAKATASAEAHAPMPLTGDPGEACNEMAAAYRQFIDVRTRRVTLENELSAVAQLERECEGRYLKAAARANELLERAAGPARVGN